MTHDTDCTCVSCMCFRLESMTMESMTAIDDAWKAHIGTVKSVLIESTPWSVNDLVPPEAMKYDPESPFEKFMRETYMSEQPQLTTKPLDELEIGQRFFFIVEGDPAENPCVYAGKSPCGQWFAYWVCDARWKHWSIEETADGEEEVICE